MSSNDVNSFSIAMIKSFEEGRMRRKASLQANREKVGFCGESWDSLVQVWRGLDSQRLDSLWQYAALASTVDDRFGDESLKHFALQVEHPERALRRGVEAYRNSHVSGPAQQTVYTSETQYLNDLCAELKERGWMVKRECEMGFGRVDALVYISEGGRRRGMQLVEAKLSSDWRAAAQALGQLLFYRGNIAGFRDVPDYGMWFACPERPTQNILDLLNRYEVSYVE